MPMYAPTMPIPESTRSDGDQRSAGPVTIRLARPEEYDLVGELTVQAYLEDGLISPEADPAGLAVTVMTALQGGLLLAQTTREIRPLELALDMAIAHAERYRTG